MIRLRHVAGLLYGGVSQTIQAFGGDDAEAFQNLCDQLYEIEGRDLSASIGSNSPLVSPNQLVAVEGERIYHEALQLARQILQREVVVDLPTDRELACGDIALADARQVSRFIKQHATACGPEVLAGVEEGERRARELFAAMEAEGLSPEEQGNRMVQEYLKLFEPLVDPK